MNRKLLVCALSLFATNAFALQPQRGYRGFLEWSNHVGDREYFGLEKKSTFFTGGSTSHGFQFNENLFVGGGLSIEKQTDDYSNNWIIPIFAEVRTDQKFGIFTPFADLRLGFSATDGGGLFVSPSIGYRFNWGRKMGINVGIGLTVKGSRSELYESNWEGDTYYFKYIGYTDHYNAMFNFRIGIDF